VAATKVIWKNRLQRFAKLLTQRNMIPEKQQVITGLQIRRKLVIYGICAKKVLGF
jgi:hypothetical protein